MVSNCFLTLYLTFITVALSDSEESLRSWVIAVVLWKMRIDGIGISFPAGSGLVAFGAALGVMPLDMPESVLV
mgnify:CR=1 FL=1